MVFGTDVLQEPTQDQAFAIGPSEESIPRHVKFVYSSRSANMYTHIEKEHVQKATSVFWHAASLGRLFQKNMLETRTDEVHIRQSGL